jgi:glycerol-3-phosphate dehydrogenase
MRPRDPSRVASKSYDLLVIGGGIHGLTIAYDAASRGLRTALVDRSDLGGESSFNHQKTVHGGLRALHALSLRRAREGVRERRAFARIAPWLLRPLPFLMGTYRSVRRGRLALRAAFKLDAWIGRDRNDGVEPELHLPPARLVSKAATLRLFPGIERKDLTGGAQWYDYQMVESDRLTIAFAAAADRAGAEIVNYVEAFAPIREGKRIAGMRIRDVVTGAEAEINAAVVVNAAGGQGGTVMRMLGVERPFPLLKAMNLVTARPASDIALAASAGDRMLTLVPWRGRALLGTGQSTTLAEPTDTGIAEHDIEALIGRANNAFPALGLARADVTLVHHGLVPAVVGKDGRADLLPASQIFDHGHDGVTGALTVAGAKYTTARLTAERVVSRAGAKLGRRLPAARTDLRRLPGAGIADHEALVIETARAAGLELRQETISRLIGHYAEHAAEIVRLMAADERLREPLVGNSPAVAAEVSYVVRAEMAVRLTDIVVRRLGLGDAGHPGVAAVRAAAAIAARELSWDQARMETEIVAVDRLYSTPTAS